MALKVQSNLLRKEMMGIEDEEQEIEKNIGGKEIRSKKSKKTSK